MSFPSPGSVQTTRDSFVVVLYVRINYKKKKITNISNYKFVGMASVQVEALQNAKPKGIGLPEIQF